MRRRSSPRLSSKRVGVLILPLRIGGLVMSKIDQVIWTRAYNLLENGFTIGADARNAKGKPVSMFAKTAVQFGPGAALMRAIIDEGASDEQIDRFLKRYRSEMELLIWFGDRGYKSTVLGIFECRAMGMGTGPKRRPRAGEARKSVNTLRQA